MTSSESVENQAVTLDGNLIVQSGGSLTLTNVTLTMTCQHNGEHRIEVEPGGSLFITNSVITAANENSFDFAVHGSAFEIHSSGLHGAGWGPEQELSNTGAITSGQRGLFVGTDNAVLDGNTLSGNHVGVILGGSGITLSSNTIISNTVHGVYMQDARDSWIVDNSIRHGGQASSPFRMSGSHNNSIISNTIESSIHRGIIEVLGSHNNTLERNTISGYGVGIAVMFISNNNVIRYNTIAVDEYGIMVFGWGNEVEGNAISGAVEPTLQNVYLHTGIYMVYAYNSTVKDNVITDVGEDNGIWLRHSSNNLISGNTASALGWFDNRPSTGLLLFSNSRDNVIHGNTFSGFHRGMSFLYDCDNNIIASNQVSSTVYQGIIVDRSFGNTVYQNNFLNMGQPPFDNGDNQWDHGNQGNYWSDYAGSGAYIIAPRGMDNHPLTTPVTVGELPVHEVVTAPVTALEPQFSQSFAEDTVIENQIINLNWIGVESGATLTLTNMTMTTGGCQYDTSGIDIEPGGTLVLQNCKITHHERGNGFVMAVPEGATLVMRDSELQGCGTDCGLMIDSSDVSLENNIITGTIIYLGGLSGGRVVSNTIVGSYQAIIINGVSNLTVAGNTIYAGVRTAISGSGSRSTFRDNTIYDIWENGMALSQSPEAVVAGNSISGISYGFVAVGVSRDNILVTGNRITNTFSAFDFGDGSGNAVTVTNNTISNCHFGFTNANSGHFANNTVHSCTLAFELDGISNVVVSNTISGCGTGVSASGLGGNVIYDNSFIDNATQAEDYAGHNDWCYGGLGNYWSDYGGLDVDGDGIGDTPYYIPPNGVDHYPQMLYETRHIFLPVVVRGY
ncbi:MAG: right-handed parallel beta-helix repeat-containing protein [Anaerolineae bacterium]|nr:right-handed parallel beta-helix repeat-containing protein [Anaerolineae bacterium]